MMDNICGDNRFEIIAKAKEHLLDATNIDTSEDEMKVLDDFLFRCWQMGWLDRYDRKTENSSEIPNNCEDLQDWKDRMWAEAIGTEPTISKMEQVDKDINVRSNSSEKPNNSTTEDCSDATTEAVEKEQTMSNRVCGECRFHKYFALKNLDFMGITIEKWYCDNWYSKRSGQITQYNDTCEEWTEEEREGE